MPRSSETPESGGRAPRKRAVRTRAARVSSHLTDLTPEQAAPEKPKRKVEAPPPAMPAEVRKAPTPLAANKVAKRRRQRQLLVVAIVLASGVGASAAVGLTDAGTIDVQQTIEARNERIRNNQATENDLLKSTVEVPVQNTNVGKPNGGLVGRGTGGLPPTPPPPATTTATSTEMIASSTEAIASSTDSITASSTESIESSTSETVAEEG